MKLSTKLSQAHQSSPLRTGKIFERWCGLPCFPSSSDTLQKQNKENRQCCNCLIFDVNKYLKTKFPILCYSNNRTKYRRVNTEIYLKNFFFTTAEVTGEFFSNPLIFCLILIANKIVRIIHDTYVFSFSQSEAGAYLHMNN